MTISKEEADRRVEKARRVVDAYKQDMWGSCIASTLVFWTAVAVTPEVLWPCIVGGYIGINWLMHRVLGRRATRGYQRALDGR